MELKIVFVTVVPEIGMHILGFTVMEATSSSSSIRDTLRVSLVGRSSCVDLYRLPCICS